MLLHNWNNYISVRTTCQWDEKTISKYILSYELWVYPVWKIFLAYLWRLKSEHTYTWLQLSSTKICCFLLEWDSQAQQSLLTLMKQYSFLQEAVILWWGGGEVLGSEHFGKIWWSCLKGLKKLVIWYVRNQTSSNTASHSRRMNTSYTTAKTQNLTTPEMLHCNI